MLGTLELGGSERQALLLARFLKDAEGASVSVLGLQGQAGAVAGECEAAGIPWRGDLVRWPGGAAGRLWQAARFARALSRERPDVVLPYTRLPNVLCGVAWRRAGARTCVWNQRDEGLGLEGGRLERAAIRRTPFFLCNSAGGKEALAARGGVPAERIAVVPNGVALKEPRDGRGAWRARLGVDEGRFAALMLANVHPHKDHATLLRAWRKVVDGAAGRGAPPLLLLAGRSYGYEGGLKSLAFDLGLAGEVRFTGPVDDVAGILGAVDLCVHSARTEGLSNSVLEAMASGLPVVGTDIPGIREAVGPDGERFLAPPGDADAFAERVLAFFGSEALRRETGALMARRARDRFDPAEMCRLAADFVLEALPVSR